MFDIFGIFSFLKKSFKRTDVLLILLLIILFLITRMTNLTLHPIFSDEGIYIHWAKVAWHDASWRFISLTDGKQPLQTWLTIPFLKFFPDNMLFAGRLFAVLGGFLSLTGIFSLLYYLYDKKTAFIGTFIYILTPYFIFYERLALVDSYVNAALIWILFLSILLVRKREIYISLLMGLVGGFFLLAKSSVQMFIALTAAAPVLLLSKNIKKLLKDSVNYFFLFAVSAVIANVIYNIQRLSPFLHYVAEKNLTFIMSFSEFLKTPFMFFSRNITQVPLLFSWESGFVLTALAFLGYVFLFKKDIKLFLYLFIWFIAPFIVISFFMKILFPRYIIFFAGLSVIAASALFYHLKNNAVKTMLIVVFLISVAYFDYTILFSPKDIPFPDVDRGQYIEGWPAGWGIKEFMDTAREQSKTRPVVIIAEGNFGMASDVLEVFLKRSDRITIKGYWPLSEKELRDNTGLLKDNTVYAFFSHQEVFPESWPLKPYKTITKPGNKSVFRIFYLTP